MFIVLLATHWLVLASCSNTTTNHALAAASLLFANQRFYGAGGACLSSPQVFAHEYYHEWETWKLFLGWLRILGTPATMVQMYE